MIELPQCYHRTVWHVWVCGCVGRIYLDLYLELREQQRSPRELAIAELRMY